MRPRHIEAENLLSAIALKYGIAVDKLKNRKNMRRFTPIIREYCEAGRAARISITALAGILQRDTTTISYHSNADLRARKDRQRPIYQPRTTEQLYRLKLRRIAREEMQAKEGT